LTQDKKTEKQYTPAEASGQLRASVTNVATLPKSARKVTESFKGNPNQERK
jgi:hypothetical protein